MSFILFLIVWERERERNTKWEEKIQFLSFIKKLTLVFKKIDFHCLCLSILLLPIFLFFIFKFFVVESLKKTTDWDETRHINWNLMGWNGFVSIFFFWRMKWVCGLWLRKMISWYGMKEKRENLYDLIIFINSHWCVI